MSRATELSTLGGIARIEGNKYPDKLIAVHHPLSPIVEAYRVLRPGVAYEFLEDDSGEGVPRGLQGQGHVVEVAENLNEFDEVFRRFMRVAKRKNMRGLAALPAPPGKTFPRVTKPEDWGNWGQ